MKDYRMLAEARCAIAVKVSANSLKEAEAKIFEMGLLPLKEIEIQETETDNIEMEQTNATS